MSLNHSPKMAYYMGEAPFPSGTRDLHIGAWRWGPLTALSALCTLRGDAGMSMGMATINTNQLSTTRRGEGFRRLAGLGFAGLDGTGGSWELGAGSREHMGTWDLHIPAERNLRCTFQFPAKDFIALHPLHPMTIDPCNTIPMPTQI